MQIHLYYPNPHRWLAATLGQLNRTDEAREAVRKAVATSPAGFDFIVQQRQPWFRPEDHEHMLGGLRKPGWQGRRVEPKLARQP